ncbi:minor tail protein [Escherichia phage vB_EcoS_PHB17]|uniref:Minor tail protein n=1 Tax=Escherichia phage vB_EcoS_PHB17 TaxID=2591407 RepID=A0A514DKQ8_9CAUD|nr:tail fiber protein [Escherichia phage vB_EcoS_PHB17]QDH94260.1 minor tail protein [Escherichia phage vB_EcoS_PHB17]
MSIYRKGQASMDAQGYITGYNTSWRDQLTLIRSGATIVFATSPATYATISEVISDTSIRATATGGAVIDRTDYVILLHDSITVDGLAQDVAETLRYYQGKETMYEEFVEFLKTFDWKKLEALDESTKQNAAKAETAATNAKASEVAAKTSQTEAKKSQDASKVSQDSASASQIAAAASQAAAKTSETNSKASENAAKASQTAAKTSETNSKASENAARASQTAAAASATAAKTSETNSKTSETKAKASETAANTSKNQAAQSAQSADASKTAAAGSATAAAGSATTAKNEADRAQRLADSFETSKLMQKENNLSDVADKALSRTNLGLGSASTYNIGTSGGTIPLLNTSNSWTGSQYILTGGLQVGSQNTGDTGVELGSVTTKTPAFIDFHSSGTGNDYDARIYVAEGSSTIAKGKMTISAGTLIYGGGDLNINDGNVRAKGGDFVAEHGGYPAFIIDNTDRAETDLFSRAMFELGPQSGAVPSLIARRRDGNKAGQIRIPFAQISGEMMVNVAYFTSAAGQLNANSRRNTEFRTFTNATTTADGIPFSGFGILTSFGRGPDRVSGNYTGQLCWNKVTNELYSRAGDDLSTTWRDWVKVTTSAVSDETLKDIKGNLNLEGALDNVNRMEFKLFRFKDDAPDRSARRGVISQQIMKIDKEYVWKVGDYYHLDQTPMLLDGLAAIKALRARDEANKERIANLEKEVEELKAIVSQLVNK